MAEKVSYNYVQSKLVTAKCCMADLGSSLVDAICVGNRKKADQIRNQLAILNYSIKALDRYIPLGTTVDGVATTIESCLSEDTNHTYAQKLLEHVLDICTCDLCQGSGPDSTVETNLILRDDGDYVLDDNGDKIIWLE